MKKVLKIIAILVGLALLTFILVFANGLVGNPLSRLLVNHDAKDYVDSHYADLELVRDAAGYDFKSGHYFVKLYSETEDDLYFTLSYNSFGKLTRDGYQHSIVEGGNVLNRLYMDYHACTGDVFEVLEEDPFFDGEYFHGFGHLVGTDGTTLALDVDYDAAQLGNTDGELDVSMDFADGVTSFERGAEALLLIDEAFANAQVGFATVNFGIYNAEGNYAYYAVAIPREDLYQEGLAQRLEAAYKATDTALYEK